MKYSSTFLLALLISYLSNAQQPKMMFSFSVQGTKTIGSENITNNSAGTGVNVTLGWLFSSEWMPFIQGSECNFETLAANFHLHFLYSAF